MRILITGGSGFVGQELISLLLRNGHQITNIDKVNSGRSDICEINHDLTTPLSTIEDHDVCIHLASGVGGLLYNQRADIVEYNRKINESINQVCSQFKNCKFIFISSINVFENDKEDIYITPISEPSNTYAKSKWEGELFFANKYPQYFVVRPSNIFGKSQISKFVSYGESHVIPDLIHKINNNDKSIEIWGDGSQLRNFIHVADLCHFLISLLDNKSEQQFFNIISTITCSIGKLSEDLISHYKPGLSIQYNTEYMKYEKVPYEWLFRTIQPTGKVNNILDGLSI